MRALAVYVRRKEFNPPFVFPPDRLLSNGPSPEAFKELIEPRSSSLSLRFDVPPPFLFHITLSSSHLFFLSLFIHRRRLGRLVTQPYFLWENTCAPLQKSDSPGVVLLESGPGGDVQEQRRSTERRRRRRRWNQICFRDSEVVGGPPPASLSLEMILENHSG